MVASLDGQYRRSERLRAVDPDNLHSRYHSLTERARLEGQGVYREALKEREFWRDAPPQLQDRAAHCVATLLGEAFEFLGLQSYSVNGHGHRIAEYRHKATDMPFQLLPAGTFTMGYGGGFSHEQPESEVIIEEPFLLSKFPVLQKHWDTLNYSVNRRWRHPQMPIVGVSWNAVTRWLFDLDPELRLPSEAEWEYAARAGCSQPYFWGDEVDPDYCWFWGNSEHRLHVVTEHAERANAFGLVDMLGHVNEWCQDSWFASHERASRTQQARSAADSPSRVLKGGSWNSTEDFLRSSSRTLSLAEGRAFTIGFRVARSLTRL